MSTSDVLTAFAIAEANVPIFGSFEQAAASGGLAKLSLGVHRGFRKPGDFLDREEFAYVIPNARLVVLSGLCMALTADGGFLPATFPKDWPYARYLSDGAPALPVRDLPTQRLDGDWLCPFIQPDHPHLYHSLLDNYGRLAWLKPLGHDLPILYPLLDSASAAMTSMAQAFLSGAKGKRIEAGVYEIERLVVPPPGNRDDRFYPLVAEFLRDRLTAAFEIKSYSHRSRLFVSRADTRVRNVVNEPELIEALRRLGFMAICPGEFSLRTQFELFATAETIAGVHGMGLTSMLLARSCRRLIEIEAFGWPGTCYSGLAGALNMEYRRIPAEILPDEDRGGFHWLGRVDVKEALAALETY